MERKTAGTFGAVLIGVVLCGGAPRAQSYTSVPIVLSGDPVPGSSAAFTGFSGVATDGTQVAFYGVDDRVEVGYYLWDGVGLATIADRSTPVPVIGGTFDIFNEIAVSGGTVVFIAQDDNRDHGVYTWAAGVVSLVAHETMALPNGLLATHFCDLDMQGGDALFLGTDSLAGTSGVYRLSGGAVSIVADTVSPLAGVSFTSVGAPVVDGARVAFWGVETGGLGGYRAYDGVSLTTLLTDAAPMPGYGCPAAGRPFGLAGNNLTLYCYDSCGEGFWSSNGGGAGYAPIIEIYATLVPGQSYFFESVWGPIADGGSVTFTALEAFVDVAIYVSFGGGHFKSVVRPGDPIPGAPGETFNTFLNHDAVGGRVAFAGGHGAPTNIFGVFMATLDPKPCGDCDLDGTVGILDALRAAQLSLGGDLLFHDSQLFRVCNVSGAVHPDPAAALSILDALVIAQYSAGLLPTLTCP